MDPMTALMMMFGGSGGAGAGPGAGMPTPAFGAPAPGPGSSGPAAPAPGGGGMSPVADKIKKFMGGFRGVANAANTEPQKQVVAAGNQGGGNRVMQGGSGLQAPGQGPIFGQPEVRALMERIFQPQTSAPAMPPVAPVNPTTPRMGGLY